MGSNLNANNINLTSTNGTTTITSAQDSSSTSSENTDQNYKDFKLTYERGRVSANSNSKVLEETTTTTTTTQKSSNLNAKNKVNILSNTDLNILSSNLTATNGTVSLTSNNGNVNILSLANTTNTTTETRLGTLTLSAGIGNSHIDTAYAEYDLIEATRALTDAKKELNHMETLRKNNQADDEAVSDAKINLAMAAANLLLAELKLAAAAAKSAASASTLWTGFYGDLRLSIEGSKTNNSSSSITAVASNINSNGNLIVSAGMSGIAGNTVINGSNLKSQTGNIEITSKTNTTINASKNTHNQATTNKSWNESVTLASSAGSGAGTAIDAAVNAASIALGVGMSRSKSDTSSTSYNNSTLNAQSGTIKINTLNDTGIKGANLLGQNIVLNTAGNLTVESLQNSYNNKSKSFGINLGGGAGASGGGSASAGVNYSSAKTDRLWTDNQTTILGTNSVTINTGNNTAIAGAVIANSTNGKIGANAIDGGNLALNTNTLTFANLYDHDYSQSSGFGISTSIGIGGGNNSSGAANNTTGQGTAPATNPGQQNNFYPSGSTTISAQNQGYKKEGTTFASVGQGNIKTGGAQMFDASGNVTTSTGGTTNDQTELAGLNRDITKSQIVTKDTITGALDVSVTIDNRLIASAFGSDTAWNSIKSEQSNLGGNLLTSNIALSDLIGAVPGSPIWASRFIDAHNDEIDPNTGEPKSHPAPNLWMGNPLDPNDVPSVGRGDDQCKNSTLCRITISDKAYELRALHYGIPGFKSFSQFHDSQMVNPDGTEKSGAYKFLSIFPFIPANYYGAVGTLIDVRNWTQNSSLNDNNSNSVSRYDKQNE